MRSYNGYFFLITAPLLFVLAPLIAPAPQVPRFHLDCGPGKLLTTGTCMPIATALSASGGTVYWVSQEAGKDSNNGSHAAPWKTISKAATVMQPKDAVIIRRGTYRESVKPPRGGTSASARITYAAYTGEEIIISGADVITGWTLVDGIWRAPWSVSLPPARASSRQISPLARRRELLVFDRQVLRPVATLAELTPGTFTVDTLTDAAPPYIYAKFPDNTGPSGHTVEAARRSITFTPASGVQYLRVTGLTFRHAANGYHDDTVSFGGFALVEENMAEWNNAAGMRFDNDSVFRGNRTNDNGQLGYKGSPQDTLIEYHQSNRNNWKGYGSPAPWESGAGKLSHAKNTTIRYAEAGDNLGPGFWFDGDNDGNTIEYSISYNNVGAGIQIELNSTNTILRNNVVFGTMKRADGRGGYGIFVLAATNVTIVHNTVYENAGAGLQIRNDHRAPNGNNKIYNNIFAYNAHEIRLQGDDLAHIRTNQIDGNLYWPLATVAGDFTFYVEYPSGPNLYRGSDIAKWRSLTQGDAKGFARDPLLANRNTKDGWRLTSRSPARGAGVTPPVAVANDADNDVRPKIGADVGADQFVAPRPVSRAMPTLRLIIISVLVWVLLCRV